MSDINPRLERIEQAVSDLGRMAIQTNRNLDRLAGTVDTMMTAMVAGFDRLDATVDRLAGSVDALRLIVQDHIENHHRGEQ
jgi:ABC-type transporter Mla subunit MlaD